MPIISVNNASIYYESQGEGYPLILIAGYGCDHTSWDPLIPWLTPYFQVITFDNRGVGQTKDDHQPLTMPLMAEDVVGLAEKLQLKNPHIVGQSMGGTIAQTVAIRHPDKIGQLVILTSTAKWRQAMLRAVNMFIVLQEKQVDFEPIFELTLSLSQGEAFLQDQKKIAAFKKTLLENPHPQSLNDQKRQFQLLETFNSRAILKQIRAQTLVVYGVEDLLSLPYESDFMAKQIPNATLLSFDCAHRIMLEKTEPLAKTLIDFFNTNAQ